MSTWTRLDWSRNSASNGCSFAQHYGRFLPQDKAAIAAKVLNEVWAA